jgi:hypothetical protein
MGCINSSHQQLSDREKRETKTPSELSREEVSGNGVRSTANTAAALDHDVVTKYDGSNKPYSEAQNYTDITPQLVESAMPTAMPLPSPHSDDPARERKFQLIKQEIMTTENTYVANMETANAVFIEPLRAAGIVDSTIMSNQFKDYIIICNLHRNLLDDLMEPNAAVGKVFLHFLPAMQMYKGFLQHFESRMKERATLLASNAGYKSFLSKGCSDARCRGSSLESFLVEPVQRIPRYKLLLEEVSTRHMTILNPRAVAVTVSHIAR